MRAMVLVFGLWVGGTAQAQSWETPPPAVQYDTSMRFNMEQNGQKMTADDFDAWMRARGLRVVGRPSPSSPSPRLLAPGLPNTTYPRAVASPQPVYNVSRQYTSQPYAEQQDGPHLTPSASPRAATPSFVVIEGTYTPSP